MQALPAYTDEHLAGLGAPELWRLLIRDEDRVPRHLIDACAARGEPILDEIGALTGKDYYFSGDVTPGEWWLPLHAVMILGLIPSHRAGELLVSCMRRLGEADDDSVEDWLSCYWPALFRNKPDDVMPLVRTYTEEESQSPHMRSHAVSVVLAHAEASSPPALEDALAWTAAIAFDEDEDFDLRLFAGNNLLDFARPEYREQLDALADLQPHMGRMFGRQEVDETYAAGGAQREWERFPDPWQFYAPEAIEERQRRWAEEDAAADEDDAEDWLDEPGVTYVRPAPKIGRNDSCPCGSGKKYKKCCLPKQV